MARINKKVVLDYFGSFFKQYSPIPKELFNNIRSIIDEAECGCCEMVQVYWIDSDISDASPAAQQLVFKDTQNNILSQTSLTESSPQRVCVPRETTQVCLNIIEVTNVGGIVNVGGSHGTTIVEPDVVGESCVDKDFPVDAVFYVGTAE